MGEHVHYWVPTILEASKESLEKAESDSMIPIIPAAICECEERLLPAEVERRLNATEMLSADAARAIVIEFRKIVVEVGAALGRSDIQEAARNIEGLDLMAYAAALSGDADGR